jgi:hypothetical protein
MPKRKAAYAGDDAVKRLLQRYRCPAPFHVVRMRFWGAIASPSFDVSPITAIQGLWSNGPPEFKDAREANTFLKPMMSLWNELTRYQDGSPRLELERIGEIDTRERLHAAAKLRAEELYDGFLEGFTGGQTEIDVPPGVGDLIRSVEKGTEVFFMIRNTFAKPPGPEDDAILAECAGNFPMVDHAVQADLNAIAVAVKRWRKERLGSKGKQPKRRGTLH